MSTSDESSEATSSDPEHPREPVAARRSRRGFWAAVAILGAAAAAVIVALFLVLFGVTPGRLFGVKSSHQAGLTEWQTQAVESAQAEGTGSARGDSGHQPSLLSLGEGESSFMTGLTDPSVSLPRVYAFSGLTFDSGSSTPMVYAKKPADALAAALENHPTARIRVRSGVGVNGSTAFEQRLSLARADAIKEMLVDRGVDASRIETAEASTGPDAGTEIELLSR
jgi:outer membrane protein OmpA-like peptidoglycan-associated protein